MARRKALCLAGADALMSPIQIAAVPETAKIERCLPALLECMAAQRWSSCDTADARSGRKLAELLDATQCKHEDWAAA